MAWKPDNYFYPGKIDVPFDRLYVPEILSRVSFPHRDPGTLIYLATDEKYILSIESGHRYNKAEHKLERIGIPFGIYPRLILILISSYAVHQKTRRIIISKNLSKFIKSLGYDVSGGKRGTIAQLNNQVERLLNCRICIRKYGQKFSSQEYLNPVKSIRVWESQESTIDDLDKKIVSVISESFYQRLQKTSFPVDPQTVEGLRSSLLALDLYFFLTSRSFRLKKTAFINWSSLEKQLGVEYKETKEFTRKAKSAIDKIRTWYPELKIDYKIGRLVILADSDPHIKKRVINRHM